MVKTIAITSAKGGVGKSTCTVEIANALRNITNKRVLVIDLDENSTLSENIGADISAPNTIYDVLTGACSINDAVQHHKLFDIIPGSKSLSKASVEFTEREDVYLLSDVIEFIKDDYDFIFVDNAPSRSVLLTMTIIAADYIIIPTMSDEGSMKMVDEMEKDISKLVNSRNHESHAEVIGYILNFYKRSNMYDLALNRLQEHINDHDEPKPFIAIVKELIIASEVKTFKTAICEDYKSSPLGRSFYDIANTIVKRIGE